MNDNTDALGKLAIAKNAQGKVHAKGRIISYCDAPTYTIEREDGERFHWRADMCEVREEYSYATAGHYDSGGYIIYNRYGYRIEPYELVKLLNSHIDRLEAEFHCPSCGRIMEWVE